MNTKFKIDGRAIGDEFPPYLIAEISANHNGSLDFALELISLAKEAGADAVKIQTYTADTMTIDSDRPEFRIRGGLWDGYSLYDLYTKAHTPFDWHETLFSYAKELDITLFSSPFDESAVDLLVKLEAPAFKVASFELVDIPLIRYIAKTGKPMIMSTGMATIDEVAEAVEVAQEGGCSQMALLHCVSGYPTPIENADLKAIQQLKSRFNVTIGLSDHSKGVIVPTVAVGLGANIIEKHFVKDRGDGGLDSEFSLEPEDFRLLRNETNAAWLSMGWGNKGDSAVEKETTKLRRSIFIVKDVKKGEVLTTDNIRRIRPGFGLAPKFYETVLGRHVNTDLYVGDPLSFEDIE